MTFTWLIFSYALLLIIDGILFQIAAPQKDIVILQPAFFGGITLLMGFMTLNKDLKVFGRHGAAALSVIAFATAVTYLSAFLQNPGKTDYQNIANTIMAILSLLFLVIAVRQFARERNSPS